MIDRFLAGAQRVIAGVIGIVLLLGLLIGLVAWARSDPEGLKKLAVTVVNAVIAFFAWLFRLAAGIIDGSGAS